MLRQWNRSRHKKIFNCQLYIENSVGKEGTKIATSTFDRRIEIKDPEAVKSLYQIVYDETPGKPLSLHPYSDKDMARSEELLKQCLSRSKR